ncbi:arginine--tRNA ligase [Candidatus Pacearchaeota archaeon]|nr:arginine--tRNA ligase [Candidatus Pacearchaeota archaeon]
MKKLVIDVLIKALKKYNYKITDEEIEKLVEAPPNAEMGDYALPCFLFANKLNMNPAQVALEIRQAIGTPSYTDFDDINTSGPYVNFVLDRKSMARQTVWDIIKEKGKYGKSKLGKGQKVIVEFSSPNIAKPFGIGHLRSTIIGNSIANIVDAAGYKSVRINYLGDWGTGFGKLMCAYSMWGDDDDLHKDPINYLLKLYVRINKIDKYDDASREWFKKLEEGDHVAMSLWRAFRELSLEDFMEIYKEMEIKFDEYSGESTVIKEAKDVIKELEEKKLLKKSQGALGVDLEEFGLGFCIIQKSDGSTIYAARDIAAAIKRHKKYKFEKMIYEVGQEQKLHFTQVFKVLELMGYDWAKNLVHAYHGLYMGQDGKKFATRKGKTVFMRDIIDETKEHAKKEIQQRVPGIKKRELEERAHKVAMAAIFYGDLKNNKANDMIFDPKKFVSFEGNTGSYILYSYARATSILKKAGGVKKFEIKELEKKEVELVKMLKAFPDVVLDANKNLSPSIIANYTYKTAQIFNEFYHSCPVIGSEEEAFRLALVESFRQVIKNSAALLGIKTIEEM